jgi:modification methylase
MSVPSEEPAVWATGQRQPQSQRDDLYLPEVLDHPAKMWVQIARHAIERYSEPGQTVMDPMCGIGTTLVEAIRAGRNAVGVECEPRWVELARCHVDRAVAAYPGAWGEVSLGDATQLADILDKRQIRRRVDLIVTSPPYGAITHGRPKSRRVTGGAIRPHAHRYAGSEAHPNQLATRSLRRLGDGLERVWAGCRAALRPGGLLVVCARPYTDNGVLIDFPALVAYTAGLAGFDLVQRCVALLGRWDGDLLHVHASFFHKHQVRTARQAGRVVFLRSHEDVLVFRSAS